MGVVTDLEIKLELLAHYLIGANARVWTLRGSGHPKGREQYGNIEEAKTA